ncbi:MAG: T9SS C-terminal target domain-containing protein [Bacteroidetes bacterium]|nr:MAG: T9SS C-terminal target domain-containing protein [Bacteroidota bacterium]
MIEVFNLEGMPVYKNRMEAGKEFKVSDLGEKKLPNGIYFVRIKNGEGIETSKLLIH